MVKRYSLDNIEDNDEPTMNEWPDGEYVKYEDYQKLEELVRAIAAIEWQLPPVVGMTEEEWRERAAALLF